jgi:thiol-disulfide isomerase/thioredoxin
MILQKTSGFTKDMYLTRFYLDAIEGKQLKLFEAVYDSTDLTHSFFTNIINREYVQLQKFIANQDTKGAHLITISSTTAGNLLDTIIAPYPNKVIYIDFWATWCSPCLAEIPYSKTLQQDYRNKDVVFLFLANRCAEDAWKATIANKELTGEHILLTTDQYNTLAAELNITGIPYYVLIDKKGNITAQNAPRPSAEKEIRSQIDNLLQ